MRIALFGGSFTPPHLAHQLVALWVLETQPVDQLWFVPCFKHPFDKALLPFENRMEMCRLAAAALGPRARVDDVEAQLGGESLTLRTVKAVKAAHPGSEISWVVGADLLAELPSWYGAAELQQLVRFVVVGREGFSGGDGPAMPRISSSEVRRRLAEGAPVAGLLPRSVLDYVRKRKLYGWPEPDSP